MDGMPTYDDDDCGDSCPTDDSVDLDYDYIYTVNSNKLPTLVELYDFCIEPSVYDTFWYFVPLFIATFSCNFAARLRFISPKLYHCASVLSGIYIVYYYAYDALSLLAIFVTVSYSYLRLPKKFRQGLVIYVPCGLTLLYCECILQSDTWHKIRGITMIAIMKYVSLALDTAHLDKSANFLEYFGYLFCGATCLFGPWTSFKTYVEVCQNMVWKTFWILHIIGYMFLAFIFLSISNCWCSWAIPDTYSKWILAYRDALSFRTSHYFISYLASSITIIGGYSPTQGFITKPLEVEIPRSLVQVVIWWNIPMHRWLKLYIFRPGRLYLGTFGGVIMTYLASSLLHGLNFQLASVLLSLGFYTYIEHKFRNLLAEEFNACIGAKECPPKKCTHLKTSHNCYSVIFVNIAFCALSVFHLAYLGQMFDMSESQETGYNFMHTINKWSELGFASHYVALFMYCSYFFIKRSSNYNEIKSTKHIN